VTTKKTPNELRHQALLHARHAAELLQMAQGLAKRATELQRQVEMLMMRSGRTGMRSHSLPS
jgi:hypothetical protein